MNIHYITERIITVIFTDTESNDKYRTHVKSMIHKLRSNHKDNYSLFNLGEKRYDLTKLSSNIVQVGWPNHHSPSLEKLCSICKSIEAWLNSSSKNVVVLHSKDDKGRIGVIIGSYLHYSTICEPNDKAFDRFAIKRFYEDKLLPFMNPSQKRYVEYFSGLLSGTIRMNYQPVFIHHVAIYGIQEEKNELRLFIKIYQDLKPIYISPLFTREHGKNLRAKFIINPSLQLTGDIMIKGYAKQQMPPGRTVLFRLQFHTCTLTGDWLVFGKSELDEACTNPKFFEKGKVEIKFSNRRELKSLITEPSEDESFMNETIDPISQWDSYENFDIVPEDKLDSELEVFALEIDNPSYTQGPLDGNLYATVTKSVRASRASSLIDGFSNHYSNTSNQRKMNTDSRMFSNTFTLPNYYESQIKSHIQPQFKNDNRILNQEVKKYQPDQNLASKNDTLKTKNVFSSSNNVEVYQNGDIKIENKLQKDKTIKLNGKRSLLISEKAQLDELLDDMMKEIEKFPDLPKSFQNQKQEIKTNITMVDPKTLTRMIDPKTETRIENSRIETPLVYSRTETKKDINKSGFKINTLPNVEITSSPSTSKEVSKLMKEVEIEESQHENNVLFGPKSPLTTMTDHFGKMEPLPQRFLTKPRAWLEDEKNRPYHARFGSQPFSYGVTEGSPALQRRRVYSESTAYVSESNPTEVYQNLEEIDSDVFSNSPSEDMTHLPWLERQQHKLKNKHEGKELKEKRIKTKRLMDELKGTMTKKNFNYEESSRDSSPLSYSKPLHINTITDSLPISKTFLNDISCQSSSSPSYSTSQISNNKQSQKYISSSITDSFYQNSPHTLQQITSNLITETDRVIAPVKKAQELLKEKIDSTNFTSQQTFTNSKIYGTSYPYAQNSIKNLNCATQVSSSPSVHLVSQKSEKFGQFDQPKSPSSLVSSKMTHTQQNNMLTNSHTVRNDEAFSTNYQQTKENFSGNDSPSVYYGQSQRSSLLSLNDSEVISQHPIFIKDTSSFWYKPNISREEVITILRDKPPGTFIIRNSNSFPGAFGLALKVANPPSNVQNKTDDPSLEYVRHFLIEPNSKGVRLKGCPNEPVFGSLPAFVYQHSITPMALSCKLIIPDCDPALDVRKAKKDLEETTSAAELLSQGAACSVLYLLTVDTESLTGPQAIKNSVNELLSMKGSVLSTVVHFKVSSNGITLTDNSHSLFFRRHYPLNTISHCSLDPDNRKYINEEQDSVSKSRLLFGFVARKIMSKVENQCHIFTEYDPDQSATAIVNFVNKVMATSSNSL